MKRKSTDYTTADAGGWRNACDDLFLAQFRGRPCEICSKTEGWDGKKIRSCGHHLVEKGMHRKYRYDTTLIVVLCPEHHSRFSRSLSPHADDTVAVWRFYRWLEDYRPEKAKLFENIDQSPFDKSWTYREMYELLGGEIASKTGLLKDLRPVNHRTKVKEVESKNS